MANDVVSHHQRTTLSDGYFVRWHTHSCVPTTSQGNLVKRKRPEDTRIQWTRTLLRNGERRALVRRRYHRRRRPPRTREESSPLKQIMSAGFIFTTPIGSSDDSARFASGRRSKLGIRLSFSLSCLIRWRRSESRRRETCSASLLTRKLHERK